MYVSAFWWDSGVGVYSPLCALAGGAEVSISQPVNSKTKHVIRFQSFAEQITITTTILGDNREKHHFIGLQGEVQGEWAFSGRLVSVSPELEGLCQGTVAIKGNVVNSLHPKLVIFWEADNNEVFPQFSLAFHCKQRELEEEGTSASRGGCEA